MPAPGMGFTDWLGRRSGELGDRLLLDPANAARDQPAASPRLRRHCLGVVRRTRDLHHRERLHYRADRGHQHFCAEERPLAPGPSPYHSPARASPNRRQSNRPVSGTPPCRARSSGPRIPSNRQSLVTAGGWLARSHLSLATAWWLIVVAVGWLALACLRRVAEDAVGHFLHRTVEIDGVLGRRVRCVGRPVGVSRSRPSGCPSFVRGVVRPTGVAHRQSRKDAASRSRACGKPEKPAFPATVGLGAALLLRGCRYLI